MAAIDVPAWQWAVLAATYVLLFLLPAVAMWRKAARDGDAPLTWASLVALTSFLGFIEYRKHRSILAKREKRQRGKPQEPQER